MRTTRGSTGLSSISSTQIQVTVQNCTGNLLGKLRGGGTIREWGGWVIGRADRENDYCSDDHRDGNDCRRCRANRDQSANFSRSPLSGNNSCRDINWRTTTLCATKISASSSPEKYRGERTTHRRVQFGNYTKWQGSSEKTDFVFTCRVKHRDNLTITSVDNMLVIDSGCDQLITNINSF